MEITPFYEKQIDCIYCSKKFPSYKVRSKFVKIAQTETDFRPIYSDPNVTALYYNVFVCEHCGFSFTEDFTKYFAPGVRDLIQEQISNKWVQHDFNGERSNSEAIQAYKLALLCGTVKKEKFVSLAGLALRLAWMYRSIEDVSQEQRFLKLARDYYIESFSVEDYAGTQMSSVRIMYMIAELSRRLSDYENATRFFSKVIEKQSIAGEAKLMDMAKEQWQLVREEREKQRA